jgi:DNA repair exonuclease SbcCD ATPase subunit
MKTFNIKSLSMKDFKGVTTQEFYDFNKIITIEGDNYTGKTTVAEGILFGLYGVDLQGSSRTDALVNNQMKRGKCEVEVVVETNEGEFKITRSATKTKKTVKIDKNEVTQKEVLEIVGDMDSFIIAYLPTHILGYKDKEAREFFMQFVDEIEPGDVLKELGGFAEPLENLDLTNIEELKKELRASNKEWERDLDFIDGRIATIDQTLRQETSPLIDTSGLEKQIKDLDESIYDESEKPQLKDVSALKEKLKQALSKVTEINIDEPVLIPNVTEKIEEIQTKLFALKNPVACNLLDTYSIEHEGKQLRIEYDRLQNELKDLSLPFVNGEICPTCSQPILDDSKLKDKTDTKKELISERIKEILKEGKKLKALLEETNRVNQDSTNQYIKTVYAYEAEKERLTAEFTKAKENQYSVQINNQKLKEKHESDLNNARLDSRKEYDRLLKELTTIENENQQTIDAYEIKKYEQRNEKRTQISTLRAELDKLNNSNQSHHLITQNIKTAKADKTKLQSDIRKTNENIETNKAALEALNEYIGEYAKMQAGQLNKYFNKVSIQLFEVTKTTGEMKPKFKLLYDEKTIEVLSLSERIRLGLEVSNFIKVATNTAYPTFIDNAESITHYDKIPGQLFTATVVEGLALHVNTI